MKIKFVYGIYPVLILHNDWSVPKLAGACARGPVISVRPKYKDKDEGILQHEMTHAKQWYRTLSMHSLLYMFSQNYRLKSEVQAYKVQASYYTNDSSTWMTNAIVTQYRISGYTKEDVIKLLKA